MNKKQKKLAIPGETNQPQGAPLPLTKDNKPMTKEQVQERLDVLEKEKVQIQQLLPTYEGAIQDCKYWLQQLSPPDTPTTE